MRTPSKLPGDRDPRLALRALGALAGLCASACRPEPDPVVPPQVAALDAAMVPRSAPGARPRGRATTPEGSCTSPPPPATGQGWALVGYRPGPALTDLVAVGHRRAVLAGTTSAAVCTSDDGARHWRPSLGEDGHPLSSPTLAPLPRLRALAVFSQGTARLPRAPEVFLSRDEGARWSPLPLPPEAREAGARARVFSDGVGRLFATTPTKLWVSSDGARWEGPRGLPGSESDHVDACGGTLLARARMAPDWFHHRSDDLGATWRPLRLGAIGLEGEGVVVRCAGYRGALEAGRAPLPSYWSLDGGRSWQPAPYDSRARQLARALADDPGRAQEAPHCEVTPVGELACMEAGRLVLPTEGDRGYVVTAPAGCEHLRLVDDRRMFAFGPGCGVFSSTDRGGLWHPTTTSFQRGAEADRGDSGQGGFLDAQTAWYLDGGLWWTDDGGQRWRLVPSRASRSFLRGTFTDRARGVFVQRDGSVVTTQDGGRTWTQLLRGEAPTVRSAGRWVMVTTADRARVSANGGETWRGWGVIPSRARLDPSLEVTGDRRRYALAPGLAVLQQGDTVVLSQRGRPDETLLRGLPLGHDLLAAHAEGRVVDRVLLTGGVVLRRERTR